MPRDAPLAASLREGLFERDSEFRAAGVRAFGDEPFAPLPVLLRRLHGRARHPPARVVEEAQVERIVVAETREQDLHGPVRRLPLGALHRTRVIHEKQQLPRRARPFRCVRRAREREECPTVAGGVFGREDVEPYGPVRIARRRTKLQDEVLVRPDRILREGHAERPGFVGRSDRVRRALRARDAPAEQRQAHAMPGVPPGLERLRVRTRRCRFVVAHVAGRERQRQPQRKPGGRGPEPQKEGRFDADGLVFREARDPEREGVVALARDKRGLMSPFDRFVVFRLRLLPFGQARRDPDDSEAHGHAAKNRVAGQREAVDRLGGRPLFQKRTVEELVQDERRKRSLDAPRHGRLLQRNRTGFGRLPPLSRRLPDFKRGASAAP